MGYLALIFNLKSRILQRFPEIFFAFIEKKKKVNQSHLFETKAFFDLTLIFKYKMSLFETLPCSKFKQMRIYHL